MALARERGVSLPEEAGKNFDDYLELLGRGNQRANLTRITSRREVYIRHFLDALELLRWRDNPPVPVLDVGSGAGVPGIPLKLARPALELTLLESVRKKTDFLRETVQSLGLCGVKVVTGRAEELGRQEEYREKYLLVVSRALARLDILLELCLPFVATGGFFAAYKGTGYAGELEQAGLALAELGAKTEEIHRYMLPEVTGERALLIFRKTGPTPARYPRRVGVPKKRPLGRQS